MAALLEELAGHETPSTAPASHGPALALLAGHLEARGMAVRRVQGDGTRDHLLARRRRRRASQHTQLIVGHLDTVWPVGTLERMPVRRADGRIHGPGVYDMKGGLVQMLFALEASAACGLEPAAAPVVFVNSDEEIGSRDSSRHLRRLAREAARAFILEPSFGPQGMLKTARKGVGRFTLTVYGRASHAGLAPESGSSAILELSHQIQRLFALNDAASGVTVNVGTIDGGLRPNVVAPQAGAVVEARVRTAADARRVEDAILSLAPVEEGTSIEVTGGFGREPMEETEGNRGLFEDARSAGRLVGLELEGAAVGGASDGNLTSRYTPTLDGLGPVGEGAHAPHEYVVAAAMAERAALLALLLATPVRGEA
jgi:glutamate carboxypeptidase